MDFTAKRQIIENIKDEVRVLHPLLKHTLRNLEGVSNVAYTHGVNEKGADFIITREDKALSRPSHIGILSRLEKLRVILMIFLGRLKNVN